MNWKTCILSLFFIGAYPISVLCTPDSTYYTTFIIQSLPAKTPHDATLYIAGEFDLWYPDVTRNRFVKQADGEYKLVLAHNRPSFEYKITRGSWDAVEGRSNGRARPNRKYNIDEHGSIVYLNVESWEDLSYGSYHTYANILVVAALQIILLVVAINTIRNKNKSANVALSALLLLIAIVLIGRASTYDPDIFNWQPKLLLAPEIILFTYAPLFYIYLHLLLKVDLPHRKYWWLHFIPSIIHITIYIPYISMNNQTFIYRVIDMDLFLVFATSGCVALFYNLGYWFYCMKALKKHRKSEKSNSTYQKYIQFLRVVLFIKAGYLAIWGFVFIIYIFGTLFDVYTLHIAELSVDLLWVLFSLIVFCIGYYAMKQPEIFKEGQPRKYKDSALPKNEFKKIKSRLEELMEIDQVYTNPDLTLPELSNMIPTSHHTLSRVINEGFNQTFSQYINQKRIHAFIKQAKTRNDVGSFLSLAFDVGFNSKATFNRSFKKHTGTNPSLYFKEAVK